MVRAPGVLSKGVLHSMQLKQAECSLHSVVLDLFRMMAGCCGVTFWKQMEQLVVVVVKEVMFETSENTSVEVLVGKNR